MRVAALHLILLLAPVAAAEVQIAGDHAVVNDAPAFRLLVNGFTPSKETRPLVLNRTAGAGTLLVFRIAAGTRLPHGSAPVETHMAQDTVAKVLLEDIQNSTAGRILSVNDVVLAGNAAMRIEYQFVSGRARQRGVDYGLFSGQTFFMIRYAAPEDAGLRAAVADFERVVRSLVLL